MISLLGNYIREKLFYLTIICNLKERQWSQINSEFEEME